MTAPMTREELLEVERFLFDAAEKAYFKACETSNPQHWMEASLLAQQHRNAMTKLNGVAQQPWQPIETAPKDGTEVLVWCDEGIDIARFSEREEDGVDSMGHDAGWWGVHQPMDPGRSMGAPAHTHDADNQPWAWMPKPKPPYDEDGERLFPSNQGASK